MLEWKIHEKIYDVSLEGRSISIPLDFDYQGEASKQPNHFSAKAASKTPMKSGSFIGDVEQGGSCNAFEVNLNPHCNGTHTETSWHIGIGNDAPFQKNCQLMYQTILLTVEPKKVSGEDTYSVEIQPTDLVITKSMLTSKFAEPGYEKIDSIEALVIRTTPNGEFKKSLRWGENTVSPFFTKEAVEYISELKIKHLIVDFPSVDKSDDGGRLLNHKICFSNGIETITEMAFISDDICDGFYGLSLGLAPFVLDATPSDIKLFKLTERS